jgi:hypothetical protein
MKTSLTVFALALALATVAYRDSTVHADSPLPPFTVSGAGLPNTLTSPACDQGKSCGGSTSGTLSRSLVTTSILIVNTDASSHTFGIQDCASTPFTLYSGSTITAGQIITIAVPVRFAGCLQWTANSTKVQGMIVYQ